MRTHTKLLFQTLTRFEDHLERVFTRLKVIGQGDLCIQLSQIPESSYGLFKKYFVNELAPRFVAGKDAEEYVLRITLHKGDEELVKTNPIKSPGTSPSEPLFLDMSGDVHRIGLAKAFLHNRLGNRQAICLSENLSLLTYAATRIYLERADKECFAAPMQPWS